MYIITKHSVLKNVKNSSRSNFFQNTKLEVHKVMIKLMLVNITTRPDFEKLHVGFSED